MNPPLGGKKNIEIKTHKKSFVWITVEEIESNVKQTNHETMNFHCVIRQFIITFYRQIRTTKQKKMRGTHIFFSLSFFFCSEIITSQEITRLRETLIICVIVSI